MKQRLLIPLVAGLCLTADQASKLWARNYLVPGITKPFIPFLLQFNLTTNTGGAFSLAQGNNRLMTAFVMVFITAIVTWVIMRERSNMPPSRAERVGMGFLLGGALGNLYDRFTQGHVTDFLDFAFVTFPVFNLADVCIDIGIILIMLSAYCEKRSWLHVSHGHEGNKQAENS